jgi:hypothetical protein
MVHLGGGRLVTGIYAMMASAAAAVGTAIVKLTKATMNVTGTGLTVTTPPVAAFIDGFDTPIFTHPVVYAWTVVMTNPPPGHEVLTAVDPTKGSTAFTATGLRRGERRGADVYCTVTQASSGKSAVSGICQVTIRRSTTS